MPTPITENKINSYEKFIFASIWLLIIFNLLSVLLIIHETHWYGPVQDFWGSIPFIDKALTTGKWYGSDLWIAQNNHRLVLPRLAFLIDYQYFSGSNYFLTGIGLTLLFSEILLFGLLINAAGVKWTHRMHIILLSAAVLGMPVIVYNLIHTFNSQWIQCATLALLSCILTTYGLEKRRIDGFIAGVITAILCHFTTFTLTAIWPSIFYLLLTYRAPKKYWVTTIAVTSIFGYCFLFILPTEDIPGGRYDFTPLLANISLSQLDYYLAAIAIYITDYFSIPFASFGEVMPGLLTILSILWFFIHLIRPSLGTTDYVGRVLMSIMLFCLCLAATTAVGRAYMGDVGSGPRFGPIVLLYWAGFITHVLLSIYYHFGSRWLNYTLVGITLIVTTVSIGQSISIGKRLSEDHNRFVMPQMAQLTGNFEKNALYENLVVEWRETSYPGIARALPYLRDNHKGIFATNIAQIINTTSPSGSYKTCGKASISQKARSNDPDIRQVSISNAIDFTTSHNYYMAIYEKSELVAVLFQKRNNPIKKLINHYEPVWIGISKKPIDISTMTLIGWDEVRGACQLSLVEKNRETY